MCMCVCLLTCVCVLVVGVGVDCWIGTHILIYHQLPHMFLFFFFPFQLMAKLEKPSAIDYLDEVEECSAVDFLNT